MAAYVRTDLLPYDFALSAEQEIELFAAVRSDLEETNDEELFSAILRFKVEEVVDRKIRLWRQQNQEKEQSNRLSEIRDSAPSYVGTFLNGQATSATIEQLGASFGIEDLEVLEAALKTRIQEWISTVDDSELERYDVVSVKDLVFAELRSWC